MTIKTLIIPTLFSIFSIFGYSQNEYDTIVIQDIETWSSSILALKINKKLNIEISEQLRLERNSSELERFFTQAKINYKVWKNIELSFGYRFFTEKKKSGLQCGNRWNIDGRYKFDIKRLSGNLRLRYQSGTEFEEQNIWENHWRIKGKLKYNFKGWKLDPFVSYEVFRGSGKDITPQFNKMRYTIGSSYKFNKKHSVSFFYGRENEINTDYPKATFLVGLGYKYTLKLSKNEK